MEDGRTAKEKYLHEFTYSGPEISVTDAKEILSNYSDGTGSVELETGANGIAKICLNNPSIKNAITGKTLKPDVINNALVFGVVLPYVFLVMFICSSP